MATTRLPRGLTTVTKTNTLGRFILPAPPTVHQFFDDFNVFNSAEWVVTGTGNPSQDVILKINGWVNFDNGALTGEHSSVQSLKETFAFETGKKFWFESIFRFRTDDASAIWWNGLYLTNADPQATAPTDGVFFRSKNSTRNIEFVSVNNSTETAIVIGNFTEDVDICLSYFYDGKGTFFIYRDKIRINRVADVDVTTDTLAPSMFVENGTGLSIEMEVDYFLAAKAR